MNREIKFRFYKPSTNKMIYPENGNFNDLIESEDWKVMQFTGFKDKKGQEIFENDLCRYNHSTSKFSVSFTFKVVFHLGSFYGYWERKMMGKLEEHYDLLSKIDLSKVKVELTKHNAIYKDGTDLRDIESKNFQ